MTTAEAGRIARYHAASGRRWVPRALWSAILERDAWTCQICLRPINPDVTRGTRANDLPSIDHIVPLVHSGSNDSTNLQAAHWGCNLRKARSLQIPLGLALA